MTKPPVRADDPSARVNETNTWSKVIWRPGNEPANDSTMSIVEIEYLGVGVDCDASNFEEKIFAHLGILSAKRQVA